MAMLETGKSYLLMTQRSALWGPPLVHAGDKHYQCATRSQDLSNSIPCLPLLHSVPSRGCWTSSATGPGCWIKTLGLHPHQGTWEPGCRPALSFWPLATDTCVPCTCRAKLRMDFKSQVTGYWPTLATVEQRALRGSPRRTSAASRVPCAQGAEGSYTFAPGLYTSPDTFGCEHCT